MYLPIWPVVFGRVVQGDAVVRAVEKLGSESGKTKQKITISNCGMLGDAGGEGGASEGGGGGEPKKKKKKKQKHANLGDVDF